MNKEERVTNLATKFMKADPSIDHVDVQCVYHVTTYLKKTPASLEEKYAVYQREGELMDYLKKLGLPVSLDFFVSSLKSPEAEQPE